MFNLVPFRKNNHVGFNTSDLGKLMDSLWEDTGFFGMIGYPGSFKTDVKETEKEYVLEAELPGVPKENISLKIENNMLTISVNTTQEHSKESANYIRKERRSGNFCRSFQLDDIKEDEISAKFENGILRLVLPKNESKREKGRHIDIQ